MAGNLVKFTILIVVVYQVMQLCQASPSPFPFPQETSSPSDGDIESPLPQETPNPLNTDEALLPQETPNPSITETPLPEETSIPSEANEIQSPQEAPIPAETDQTLLPQEPSTSSDNEPQNLIPTDPMDLNKMGFSSLLKLYGKLGPLIYTLLTDENALGEQLSGVSKLIANRIGLDNYTEDMNLIFSNVVNPMVSEKLFHIYDQIKDIGVQGTTDRTLKDAVEIISNILQDDKAIDEMITIIKTSQV